MASTSLTGSVTGSRLLPLALAGLALAGCGGGGAHGGGGGGGSGGGRERGGGGSSSTPALVQNAERKKPRPAPTPTALMTTKNTTRVGGRNAIADAAAVARAVYPARTPETRPEAVVLVDSGDWRAAISAAQLMSAPLRAPLLYSTGSDLPAATRQALHDLAPTGADKADGAQVIRVGDAPAPEGLKSIRLQGGTPAALARAIDRLHTRAAGHSSPAAVVAPEGRAPLAMPAAGWAAKSGEPVLWAGKAALPRDTVAALEADRRPRIYVLGPPEAISDSVLARLRRVGATKRIGTGDPIANAIFFARYADGAFGWNVVDPGHGLVFANLHRTGDAAAAAPLSASGTWGPLLLVSDAAALPGPVQEYLLDIQPGYDKDPVRGVYNHGWFVGDESAISADVQSRIDALLEIQPVDTGGE